MRKQIWQDIIAGCAPIAAGFIIAALFCILITMCGCRTQKEYIEVEKWQHDTTTVTDTLRLTEQVIVHDSIYKTEYVTQFLKDSTHKDEQWQYTTYDPSGNITSQLNYSSSTHHGSSSNTAAQSESTSTSNTQYQKEETSSHNESSGHSDASHVKKETKPQLNKWQRFIMGLGYAMLIILCGGAVFGGFKIYRRTHK